MKYSKKYTQSRNKYKIKVKQLDVAINESIYDGSKKNGDNKFHCCSRRIKLRSVEMELKSL